MWHRLFLAQRFFAVYHLTDLLKLLSRTEERRSAVDISYWEPELDLRSSLSFTAKRRSTLAQEVPNKGREMETHRNRSLCSHDLIRHGGARLSGSSAAYCANGRSERKLRGCREKVRITLLSLGAAPPWGRIDSELRKRVVVLTI